MISKLKKKLRPSGQSYIIHDTKKDIHTIAKQVNELIDKMNEIIQVINTIEEKEKSRRKTNGT